MHGYDEGGCDGWSKSLQKKKVAIYDSSRNGGGRKQRGHWECKKRDLQNGEVP